MQSCHEFSSILILIIMSSDLFLGTHILIDISSTNRQYICIPRSSACYFLGGHVLYDTTSLGLCGLV
jgi:hypothetical protein